MIFHLVSKADWEAQAGDKPFRAASLDSEGFIHCTKGEQQMLSVANAFYKSQSGEILVLHIDESKLTSEVKWEAPAPLSGSADAQVSGGTEAQEQMPPEAKVEFGGSAFSPAPLPPSPSAALLFPHVYGPINRDAIVGMRRFVRLEDGTFTGYAQIDDLPAPVSDPANPLNVKSPSQMAQELLDATDEFSESLKRFKDSVEGRMAVIDEKIKKL